MNAFNELADNMREVYRLYKAENALRVSVTPGGHNDSEAIRLPVYSFFLKELLGKDVPVTSEGPVDLPTAEELVCYRNGLPVDERLTRIDEELIPVGRGGKLSIGELTAVLRREVFRYFPQKATPLRPEWSEQKAVQGRRVQPVTFTSLEGLRVKGIYSLPAEKATAATLPGLVLVDHRKGIPVWGNEQPLERNQWGNRAVLIIEVVDRGSRALEQNLRSFADDDALHHMKRQAMIAGTTLESIQVYEILRAIELIRTLPDVDRARIAILGKGEIGVSGMYAALLDGRVQRVILDSPPASHRQGPHYPGILRYTDVPETATLLAGKLSISGEVPDALRSAAFCRSLSDCLPH